MNTKKIFFISDAHFGINLAGYDDREKRFLDFVESEKDKFAELYILGDLFDFWIEYRHTIRSDYFEVLHSLKNLIKEGVVIHYLAGNHDFALGSFLESIGIKIYSNSLLKTIQSKKVYLFHGDGIPKDDFGYRILKKLLRNKSCQRIYKLLHPAIGIPLGSFVSGSSRKYLNKPLSEKVKEEYRQHAKLMLKEQKCDIVIYAHIHYPDYVDYPEGIYCNIGSWLKHYSYGVMENGYLSLWTLDEKGLSHPLSL
ncbi:MAG: UDP-2,3-diacylglucosamine diphosphatase [Chitinispirillaceae bacterium]|nr:UDP-2,3-diacylglucosamine diphosphatase [Chitinispirillaceae bacterium]